ncbi:MAG: hypothetical protein JRJ31_22195, partial [Deltaproteobacteria bacterium]|nr:hypothetical protein [Deltaproteobacteria bacterium]
ALKAATINGEVDRDIFREQYHKNIHGLFTGLEKISRGNTDLEFGASSLVGEPIKVFKRAWERHKDAGNEAERFNKALEEFRSKEGIPADLYDLTH